MLNQSQIEFLAQNYAIVSLEKCFGINQGLSTEVAIYNTAMQLKAINPDIKAC